MGKIYELVEDFRDWNNEVNRCISNAEASISEVKDYAEYSRTNMHNVYRYIRESYISFVKKDTNDLIVTNLLNEEIISIIFNFMVSKLNIDDDFDTIKDSLNEFFTENTSGLARTIMTYPDVIDLIVRFMVS